MEVIIQTGSSGGVLLVVDGEAVIAKVALSNYQMIDVARALMVNVSLEELENELR